MSWRCKRPRRRNTGNTGKSDEGTQENWHRLASVPGKTIGRMKTMYIKQKWDYFIVTILAFELYWFVELSIRGGSFFTSEIITNVLLATVVSAVGLTVYDWIKNWLWK